jgi:acetyl esterase/lipase
MKMKFPAVVLLALGALSVPSARGADPSVRLFLAGDSTMARKAPPPENPERGWGEALPFFLDNSIAVDNRALNGRSTVSFRSEGHWDAILADLKDGDWVLIQFGHNDQKANDPARYAEARTAYRENLTRFIREVRARGGNPLLATPIVRRSFDRSGDLIPTHGDYPETVRQVSRSESVPLVDLHARTRALVGKLGEVGSRDFYLWPTAGQYARFPQGIEDNTHLSSWGASLVAQMAVEEITRLQLPLAARVQQPVPDFGAVEWIPLAPAAPGDTETERFENERVSNVRRPGLGVFRSTLGSAPRAAVVLCPGGGYSILAIVKEGYEIARWFNALGIDAYVLKYRLREFGYPAPLQDAALAIRFLRATAGERGLDPAKIGILGFSAGGHTAAMATTLYASPDARTGGPLDKVSARPDFSVLAYPVVTMADPHTHRGSRDNLLGNSPAPETIAKLSLEGQVSADTPPVFLFHSADDEAVPVENSLHFAAAMARHDRPFALHVVPSAPHGIGMRPGFGLASAWPEALAAWLADRGLVPGPAPAAGPGR